MFSSGTTYLVLGKPKFVALADALCNLTPLHLGCIVDPCFDQNLNSSLIAARKDPDFDASLKEFHYARVIEIPTPRWTAYDALRYGIKMSDEVAMTTQERAYTSPI